MLLPLSAAAQLSVLVSPQPKQITAPLHIGAGLWSVEACNGSAAPITLTEERLAMAFPSVRFAPSYLAASQLASVRKANPWSRVAQIVGFAGSLAMVFISGGTIMATQKVLAAVGLGAIAATETAALLQSAAPDTASLQAELMGPQVAVPAGGCVSKLLVGPVPKGATAQQAMVQFK